MKLKYSKKIIRSSAVMITALLSVGFCLDAGAEVRLAQTMSEKNELKASVFPQAEAEDKSIKIEEIVVTAQKREEKLQDVPISITALSGEKLDGTTQSITEELTRVPGVAALTSIFGSPQLTVRGVTSTAPTYSGTNSVGYYLDTVPFGFVRSAIAPDPNAFDLERVEILRGPQGTLYGANAQNGVVRVLTKDANLNDLELKARAATSRSRASAGNNYRGDIAINVPVVEGKLAARAVVGIEDWSGWIDRPNHKDANDAENRNLRLKLNAQPNDKLSVGVSTWFSKSGSDAKSRGLDTRTEPVVIDEPILNEFDAYGLRVGYDFQSISLTSSTSYLDFKNRTVVDDFSGGLGTSPLTQIFASDVFAQEVNVNSTNEGSWRWSLGGIYRDVHDRFRSSVNLYPNPNGIQYDDLSESFAVYGELTRGFFDNSVELTGGLRYFEDSVINRQLSNPFNASAALIRSSADFEALSPRFVLTLHPGDESTIYGSYSEGFRSGFSQSPTVIASAPDFPPVDSDNLTNYELGAKGSIGGGLINYDAAVFYIDWQDIQQSVAVNVNVGGSSSIPITGVINGESASGLGAEFGLSIRPASGLEVGLNYSWNDLAIDADVVDARGVRLFSKGDRLTNSPSKTAGIWADYVFSLGVGGYKGRFSGSANYISERQVRGLSGGVSIVAHGDSLFTSRISFGLDAPAGWRASVFVDNLNDYDGVAAPEISPAGLGQERIRPRTMGLQFEYRM